MRRLLALWLVLAASFWAGRIAISLSLFSAIDLTYRSFLELIVVPGLQAVAVTWATRRKEGGPLLAPWRHALRLWPLRLVLGLDLAILAAAWLALAAAPAALRISAAGWPAALTFSTAAGLPRLAPAAKLAAAAALFAIAAWRRKDDALPPATRWAALALAAAAAILALEPLTGWLAGGPQSLFPGQPPLVRWLRFYLPLLLGLLLLLLAAQAALAKPRAEASRAIDWVLAATLLLAAIMAGGFFLHPYLRDPWRSAAWTAGSAASTALLLAGALAARRPASGAGIPSPAPGNGTSPSGETAISLGAESRNSEIGRRAPW
jgi:hypothetical protein